MKKYISIDYKNWIIGDSAREGINLKRLNLLSKKELKIWDEAISYQDQRNDPGQAEVVTYFSIKLLEYINGNRKIVVPAAILHDTGFWGSDPEAWKRLVNSGTNYEAEEHRRPHQNRGCLIAGRILERVGYNEKYQNEIADIIGDHDTRKLPATTNGEIVRAADLIWRVTYPCMQIYFPDFSVRESIKRMEDVVFNLPLSHKLRDVEKKIARLELVNSILFKFKDESKEFLKNEYSQELIEIAN